MIPPVLDIARLGLSQLPRLMDGGQDPVPAMDNDAAAPAPAPPQETRPGTPIDNAGLPEAPRAKTYAEIEAEMGLPPAETGLPRPPSMDTHAWDVIGAGWQAETIRTDAWGDSRRRRRDLAMSIAEALPDEAWRQVAGRMGGASSNWTSFEQAVVEGAAALAEADPAVAEALAGLPLTVEDFDARITAERKADLDAAQAILDLPGGGLAEFVGATARAMTDETSLLLMPFGFQGSVVRRIAGEAALGAAGEAAILPREYRVAEELGLEDPDPVARIALGAGFGAGFAGAIIGGVRALDWLWNRHAARQAGQTATRPDGVASVQYEAEVTAAEAAMRGEETVQERLRAAGRAAAAPQQQPDTLGAIVADGRPGGAAFSRVVEAGNGYTVLVGPDGAAVRREGTRAWRNNNPGNIEFGSFAQSMGAIGTDGRFAVFPTYEMGRRAKAQLLWGSRGYRGRTIGEAISRYAPPSENDTGAYTRAITKALDVPANTQMASLTPQQRETMLNIMERVEGFRPGRENGVPVPGPRRGMVNPEDPSQDVPGFSPTARGYTSDGQVSAGDGWRIDVDYQVVDASSLLRASGDLQPRDRSRGTSDAWISDTAGRLDPAQLMRSPTADRGAPIVGPDNVIESGNGRYGAITRAYEHHPDRAAAYRARIEAEGFVIPEGILHPVLIARRRTELSPEERARFAIEAQDSGVAAMTPTEVARASSRAMTAPVLARLDPAQPLRADGNAGFVRAALQGLPRSARNAMFDAGGMLNTAGERQLREALFARAWPDPDILAHFTETDAGELKSLMEALERAAPAWAALKADIEAGLVNPDMDISAFVLDAMRLIGAARDLSKRQKLPITDAVQELLDEVDLLEGALAPLTVSLVRRFWRDGRAASAEDVAGFLTRYADDARKAGATGSMFDAPGPRDVLIAIDRKAFGNLPEDLGTARGFAQPDGRVEVEVDPVPAREDGFDAGATSPEAQAVDAEIRADLDTGSGRFGPIHHDLAGRPQDAVDRLLADRNGEVPGALSHPDVPAPIDLIWGEAPTAGREGFGLAKIAAKHPEVLNDIQGFLSRLTRDEARSGANRIRLSDPNGNAVVRLDYDGETKTWLMTAYEKRAGRDATTDTAHSNAPDDTAGRGTGTADNIGREGASDNIGDTGADLSAVELRQRLEAARADLGEDFAGFAVDGPDGTSSTVREILEDLEADRAADDALDTCLINPAATFSKGAGA